MRYKSFLTQYVAVFLEVLFFSFLFFSFLFSAAQVGHSGVSYTSNYSAQFLARSSRLKRPK
jgi:hypothetical protein